MIQIYETTHLTKKNSNREMPEKLQEYVKEYNYITFSSKSERLVSLSTQVEPVVIIWNIGEFITYAAHLRLNSSIICEEVKINPNNANYISVCGKENFRLLKYNDDELVVYSNSIVFKESKLTVSDIWRDIEWLTYLGLCLPYLAGASSQWFGSVDSEQECLLHQRTWRI